MPEKLFSVTVDWVDCPDYPDFLHDNSGREAGFINHAQGGNECQQKGRERFLVFYEYTQYRGEGVKSCQLMFFLFKFEHSYMIMKIVWVIK